MECKNTNADKEEVREDTSGSLVGKKSGSDSQVVVTEEMGNLQSKSNREDENEKTNNENRHTHSVDVDVDCAERIEDLPTKKAELDKPEEEITASPLEKSMDVDETEEKEEADDKVENVEVEVEVEEPRHIPKAKASSTPAMTTRSGCLFGGSIRKTLFSSGGGRRLSLSAAKRRMVSSADVQKKQKFSGGSPQLPQKKQIVMNKDDLFSQLQDMLKQSEERLSATIDKKHDEYLKEFRKTATSLKKEQKDFMKEQKDRLNKIEEESKKALVAINSQDKMIKKMEKDIKQINTKAQTTKNELEKGLESKKRYIEAEIVDTKDILKKAQESSKESRKKIHERIDLCVGRVSTLEDNVKEVIDGMSPDQAGYTLQEYPVKCTAVARFVKQPVGVSPTKLGKVIINEALELDDVNVVRVKSMSCNKNKIGTLKIQLGTPEELQRVLEAKSKLGEFDDDPDIKSIRLRQSKTQEQLVAEQNADAMLKAMDLYEDFFRTDKGYLLPRDQQKRQNTQHSRGQNRGRGNWRNRRGQPRNHFGAARSTPRRPSGNTQSESGDNSDNEPDIRPARRCLSVETRALIGGKRGPQEENAETSGAPRKKKQPKNIITNNTTAVH